MTASTDTQSLVEIPTVRSFEDVDQVLLKIASCEQELQQAEAKMNEQIQLIRDGYERNTAITRAMKSQLEDELERYCIAHKDEFQKTRSREMVHGVVGFRSAPPKVALLNRKYKWETVLELLKKFRWAADFVRTKDEVSKESILASYAAKDIDDQKLAAVGLKIDQDEKFFADIKWEEIPTQSTHS